MKRSLISMLLVICADIILISGLFMLLKESRKEVIDFSSFSVNDSLALQRFTSEKLHPIDEEKTNIQSTYKMCLYVYTGTARTVYHISNPSGVTGFQEYHLENFDQRLVGTNANSIDVEVVTKYYVDTTSPYPVDRNSLPENIKNNYLQPETLIQSDHPEIIDHANSLIAKSTRQAEAVESILTWIGANIEYDYDAIANDALSVYRNRRAICVGFSTLSVALLRAAGIPSRLQGGCDLRGAGIGHEWIETYYPDVGWVASEPQGSANFISPDVIVEGFDQCGSSGTIISVTSYIHNNYETLNLRTPLDDPNGNDFRAATIPSWDRQPLLVTPESPIRMLPITNPIGSLALRVESMSCSGYGTWQVRADVPWLNPKIITGTTAGDALFSINASGMPTGTYTSDLTLYTTSFQDEWNLQNALSRTITAKLLLVDRVYNINLPLLTK